MPWVVVTGLFIASHIERGRHGRYMYRLALRHVWEESVWTRQAGEAVDVGAITTKLREEVGRG